MNHGRDHQEREQKLGIGRRRSTPEPDSIEAGMLASGRTHATPPQYVFGANPERRAPAAELDEPEPVGDGAEVAPTRKAEARERARHREERKRGRMTAGAGENLRDRREPELTREDLEEAAKVADAEVANRSR
jgi:hypothetical protein